MYDCAELSNKQLVDLKNAIEVEQYRRALESIERYDFSDEEKEMLNKCTGSSFRYTVFREVIPSFQKRNPIPAFIIYNKILSYLGEKPLCK